MDAALTPPTPAETEVDRRSVGWLLDGVVCLSGTGTCRDDGATRRTDEPSR